MSFGLYDEDGYVGQVASIEGYGELIELTRWGTFPALQSFFDKGMSRSPKKVYDELRVLLSKVTSLDSDTRDTLTNLKDLLAKETKKEVIIIHG